MNTDDLRRGLALAARVVDRLNDRDRLIEVAARGLYERDENSMRGTARWADADPDIRIIYIADAAPDVDALLDHLTGRGA